ncbi:MAG: hypothetical protein U0T75_04685 [Chitinophagales bacterium]
MTSSVPIYIIAVVITLLFILIAALVSSAIQFEGGSNPKDPGKRKMWFWIFAILGTVGNLAFGLFYYYFPETNNYAKSQLITAIGISTGITFIAYIIIGFVLSKIFKNGKLGHWF